MKYYTTKEAAEYLRVGEESIRVWYRKGKLKGFKRGAKNLLFTKEQLDAVLVPKNSSRNWFSNLIHGKNKRHIDAKTV